MPKFFNRFSSWGADKGALAPQTSWVYVANGGTAYLDNVLRFGFEDGKNNPIHVTKISRLPENSWMLRAEYDNLCTLWECLDDEAAERLPQPLALENVGKESRLLLSYVSGHSLGNTIRSAFWSGADNFLNLAIDAAKSLRLFHDRTARPKKTKISPKFDFEVRANKFMSLFDLSLSEAQILHKLAENVDNNIKNAAKEVLVQNDFWHGNLIRGDEHGELVFIDWQFGHWASDISFDVYLFLIAGALAAVPYGDEVSRAKAAAEQLFHWQDDLIPAYLNAYGEPDGWRLLPLREGLLACCVEKAARTEIIFNTRHPDDLMWRVIFGELLSWTVQEEAKP